MRFSLKLAHRPRKQGGTAGTSGPVQVTSRRLEYRFHRRKRLQILRREQTLRFECIVSELVCLDSKPYCQMEVPRCLTFSLLCSIHFASGPGGVGAGAVD
jgi:hypothetical protein